ncbi:DUF3800 domain-containing protein [Enterococcus hirae]|uniref:DUF3800 domain-containing protein n=1 Tax=Enterococcus hirae TaxID=1354 RepID=A0AB37I8H2_ENTHR|nr:DUF3800 domain-containing protein [Enterococcus hirae]RBT56138.1 hypothetical protein EB10_00148 [Enterococcus hirae]RBT60311.1 hypothetical protein EB39_01778 [Enterococcus hirae]RBT65960.1 hypothetical protein EB03_02894 [Enterococcus hirae]
MQKVYFYFDDSGVLHKNDPNRYFVYAGLFFLDNNSKDKFKRKYFSINKEIKKHLGLEGELKACFIKDPKYKASLFRTMKYENTMGLTVDIERVYSNILSSKKSIHRYKDYVLKRLVKEELKYHIRLGNLDPSEDIQINICVDEQATATDGFYSLKDSIFEELKKGIVNFDYGSFHEPLFTSEVKVNVSYCNSANNYLIQASDILANRLWTSFIKGNKELRKIPNHRCLRLP